MLNVALFSRHYAVHRLDDADVDAILELCRGNTQFYEYCEAEPTREQVLNDLHITPPGMDASSKYFVGFFRNGTLMAVMDLIDGYPEQETGYIGFFMMDRAYQGCGLGSAIIDEVTEYLHLIGKKRVRLAIDKENPQSTHFWRKNGFKVIREVDRNGWTKLVAERTL